MELAVVQSEERVVMYTQMNILFPKLKVELDLHGNHSNLIPMQKLLQLLLMHMIQLFTLVESSGLRIIAQIQGGVILVRSILEFQLRRLTDAR